MEPKEVLKFMTKQQQILVYNAAINSTCFEGSFECFCECFWDDTFNLKTKEPLNVGMTKHDKPLQEPIGILNNIHLLFQQNK
ncbi:hypothetical protein LCGC14_2966520 [marine sediment metagenome]|uniref:Uncharacterized protein n=1 Tax=marine sediment metagenome TaxID=412755 RepID=A0A0F8XAL9_9ZZZZ